jgi:hypothetical protein
MMHPAFENKGNGRKTPVRMRTHATMVWILVLWHFHVCMMQKHKWINLFNFYCWERLPHGETTHIKRVCI